MAHDDKAAEAAKLLLAARKTSTPIAGLPAGCRPTSVAEAYAIQDLVGAELEPVGGWKVGLNPATGEITCAPIPADLVIPAGATLSAARFHGLALEIEFAFRMAADLPDRATPYSRAEVAAAVEGFCPAIEVIASRYIDRTSQDALSLLADCNANGLLAWGAVVPEWQGIDFRTLQAQLQVDGRLVQDATGTHPAEHPFDLVVWMANHAASRGSALTRGTVVTTGSLQGVSEVQAGAAVEARYTGQPPLTLRFT